MSTGFSVDALSELLERVAKAVRAGDSLEGSIAYRLPLDNEVDGNGLMVDAAIRTGNLDGQGSVILIGNRS